MRWADFYARPDSLLAFLGRDAEADASVERHGFNLDIESLAVGMLPCAADARPDGVAAFAVAHMVGDVGWDF